LKDKEIGCYNKAISALWFSIENLIKALMLKVKGSYSNKVGTLLNFFSNFVKNSNINLDVVESVREIYLARMHIDHKLLIMDKTRCEVIFNKAEDVLRALEKMLEMELI